MAGVSNAELDRLSGLRRGHTWALERKEQPNPELRTLAALAATLGATVGYLANGEGDGPTIAQVQAAIGEARKPSQKVSA